MRCLKYALNNFKEPEVADAFSRWFMRWLRCARGD
jgi:hypothetical protein